MMARRRLPWGWCAMAAWLRGTAPPPLPQHTHAHPYVHLTDGPLTGADRDAALADATLSDASCAQLLGVTVAEAQRLRAALANREASANRREPPRGDAVTGRRTGGAPAHRAGASRENPTPRGNPTTRENPTPRGGCNLYGWWGGGPNVVPPVGFFLAPGSLTLYSGACNLRCETWIPHRKGRSDGHDTSRQTRSGRRCERSPAWACLRRMWPSCYS